MRRSLIAISLWLLPGVAVAQLSMSFGTTDVTVSGMTKGGEAALVSLSRDTQGWVASVTPMSALLSDDNGDGSETYVLASQLVKRSVWVAVDVSTGETIVVSPGFSGRQSKIDPSQAIQMGKGGLYSLLLDQRAVLDLTVVRPQRGAWHIRAWDGGTNDSDLDPNGTIQVDAQAMTPMARSHGVLADFQVGDILVGLDHTNLEYYAVAVVTRPGKS